MFSVQVTPTPETRALLADMAATDLAPEVRAVLGGTTAPAVARIRARISTMPSSTPHTGTSLRAALAKALTYVVRQTPRGIYIRVAIAMHGGKENLARAVEGEIPWKHPTYGREPEQHQDPYPFFNGPVEAATAAIDYKLRIAINARLGL